MVACSRSQKREPGELCTQAITCQLLGSLPEASLTAGDRLVTMGALPQLVNILESSSK